MRKKKNKHSVQNLIGIKGFSDYGLSTEHGELIFFTIRPQNISVLSYETVAQKVRQLQQLLSAVPELELLCLDSCESFEENQRHIKSLLETEQNPAVRRVLEQDITHLDGIQLEMATARQFLFMIRMKSEKQDQIFAQANRVEKAISEQGFEVRRLDHPSLKRLLRLFFNGIVFENREAGSPTAGGEEFYSGKDFFDTILPTTIKFNVDHYICGDRFCSTWALKDYPPSTDAQALFAQLADRAGVTLRVYNRPVDSPEQRKILQNATRKNRFAAKANDAQESINAEENLQDVATLLANLRRNREPLLHCAVFIELHAASLDALRELQQEINMELTRSKLGVDRLTLRQQEGFLSAGPCGFNQFDVQFERVLPASSVANFYPLNYSGKTDPAGFYLGRDKFGTNILVDFDRRAEDKTNANTLILGNSGQGKSYLMKLILANLRASGKTILALDPEAEYAELCENLGGCYVDFMSGEYMINPLEPKSWADAESLDTEGPEAFRRTTRLSQHIAYLKDFFRAYKDFTDAQIDTIEILLEKMYANHGITDRTDFNRLAPSDYPTMEDFYALVEQEFQDFSPHQGFSPQLPCGTDPELAFESLPLIPQGKHLYTEETLQEICLGLHSMCRGAESKFFNGHTNVTDSCFLVFGVKGLMDTNQRLKNTMLFNILAFMTHQLLGRGNAVAAIDELYLFLSNMTTIEYIRNAMKRVRKKESALVLASQNVEDFLLPGVKEYTKPLFSIPTHQFLFNAGNIEPRVFTDTLQLEPSEFERIKYPERGTCLYRCGNERYLLHVIAPEHKRALFGTAGGR